MAIALEIGKRPKSAGSGAAGVIFVAVVIGVTVKAMAVFTPTLCPAGDDSCNSVLIEPTTSPGYVDCIRKVGSKCVGGNSAVAQAPFDPSSACPLTTLYDLTGLMIDATSIGDQVRAVSHTFGVPSAGGHCACH